MKPEAGKFIYYPKSWKGYPQGRPLFFYAIRKKNSYEWVVYKSALKKPINDLVDEISLFENAVPLEGNLDLPKKMVIRGILK